jgi:cellulose synthase/poly-beta-1,6-N-acetylglucosamine synthase-like glycosyltransferase
MSNLCKVSVVIPCFNHGDFLPEAAASVISLKRSDIELIVVDDGSTDEQTRREMHKLAAQGTKVLRQENKGLAAARNAGILASHGEYIRPLDADVCGLPISIMESESWMRTLKSESSMGTRNTQGQNWTLARRSI